MFTMPALTHVHLERYTALADSKRRAAVGCIVYESMSASDQYSRENLLVKGIVFGIQHRFQHALGDVYHHDCFAT